MGPTLFSFSSPLNLTFRLGEDGLTVHFNVHMDPSKGEPKSDELLTVIKHEIQMAANSTQSILGELVIDDESLEIQGKFQHYLQ